MKLDFFLSKSTKGQNEYEIPTGNANAPKAWLRYMFIK